MSSPPTKYVKSFDYAIFNPSLNVDFDRLKTTTDQTIDRLALIQRDDGALRDGSITTNSLADKSVTEPKLADLSVSTRTLQLGSVYGAIIADGGIFHSHLTVACVNGFNIDIDSINTAKLLDLCVTTPKLADAAVTSAKLGPSLALAGVPTAPTAITGTNTTQLATTAFVAASMSAAGMITEAPNDGQLYGRHSLGWQRGVALAGDTMTGLLLLSADPAAALGAATKQYVDAAALALSTGKVSKAGDTMTGPLIVPGLTATGAINGTDGFFSGGISAVGLNATGNGQFAKVGIGMAPVNVLDITNDVVGAATIKLLNPNAGAGAAAGVQFHNSVDSVTFGLLGKNYPTTNIYAAGRAYISSSKSLAIIGGQEILFGTNGSTAERMRLGVDGQLFVAGARGNKRHTTKDHVATNNQVTAFKWPIELSNYSCSVRVKVTAVNDDGNTGYTSVYREIVGNYSCFAGNIVFAGMIQVAHHPQSVNAGVCAINCAVGLVQSPPGQMNLTVTPLSSGSTGVSTARITVSMELIGIDDYQAIQAFTGST